MEAEKSFPRFFGWGDQRPFVFKIGIPGILLLGAILVFRSAITPGAIVLGLLLGLWAITQFSIVGLMMPEEECLYYRRFFHWERLEYRDAVKCGRSFFWGLQYLKLKYYAPPFGKLYFIPYSPGPVLGQRERISKQTIYIRHRIEKNC